MTLHAERSTIRNPAILFVGLFILVAGGPPARAGDDRPDLLEEARKQLSADDYNLVSRIRFTNFSFAPMSLRDFTLQCHLAITNADNTKSTGGELGFTVEVRYLCFDDKGQPRVVVCDREATPAPNFGNSRSQMIGAITTQTLDAYNNDTWEPHNAYVRIFLNNVPVRELLWRKRNAKTLYKADDETYWFDDESLVAGPAGAAAPAEPTGGTVPLRTTQEILGEQDDSPQPSPRRDGQINWQALPHEVQKGRDTLIDVATRAKADAITAKQDAQAAQLDELIEARKALLIDLQAVHQSLLAAKEQAQEAQEAIDRLKVQFSSDPSSVLESVGELSSSSGTKAIGVYKQRLSRSKAAYDEAMMSADSGCQARIWTSHKQLQGAVAAAIRSALQRQDTAAADELKAVFEELKKGPEALISGPASDVSDSVTYLGQDRSSAWFNEMYERFHDKIAEIDGRYYDIGESKLTRVRVVAEGSLGSHVLIRGGTVRKIISPTQMLVYVPKQGFKSRKWRFGQWADVYETDPEQLFLVVMDTSAHRKGYRFSGGVVITVHSTTPGEAQVKPYQPLTREQFADALSSGHVLVRYAEDKKRGIKREQEQ